MGERPRTRRAGGPEPSSRPLAKPPKRRRVFIADARGNGNYLRTTWHSEGRMFVVSIWHEELSAEGRRHHGAADGGRAGVCLGAIRVPVEDAAEIVSLLMDGLVEVVADGPLSEVELPPRAPILRSWDSFRAQLRAWARHGANKAAAVKRLRITTEPPREPRSRPRRSA